jgi:hypothetical protein
MGQTQQQQQQQHSNVVAEPSGLSKTTIGVNSDYLEQQRRSQPTRRQPINRQRKPTVDNANTAAATAAADGDRPAALDDRRRSGFTADQSRQMAFRFGKTAHADSGGMPRRFDRQLPVPTTRRRTSGAAGMSAAAQQADDATSTSSSSGTSTAESDGSTLPAIDRPTALVGVLETGRATATTASCRLPPRQLADSSVPLKVKRPAYRDVTIRHHTPAARSVLKYSNSGNNSQICLLYRCCSCVNITQVSVLHIRYIIEHYNTENLDSQSLQVLWHYLGFHYCMTCKYIFFVDYVTP